MNEQTFWNTILTESNMVRNELSGSKFFPSRHTGSTPLPLPHQPVTSKLSKYNPYTVQCCIPMVSHCFLLYTCNIYVHVNTYIYLVNNTTGSFSFISKGCMSESQSFYSAEYICTHNASDLVRLVQKRHKATRHEQNLTNVCTLRY